MKLTDEAVEAAARVDRASRVGYDDWESAPKRAREALLAHARAVLAAAAAHLTDDGATPFELETERISWHRKEGYEAGLAARRATPATNHRPTCGTTYGESCDGYCPPPAIDREALAKLIAIRRWDASVPSTDLADMVLALIGAPNSGASEEDQ